MSSKSTAWPQTTEQQRHEETQRAEVRDMRLQIMVNHEELEAIDNWRFKMHMPNRAAAVKELIDRGLRADGFDVADGRKSTDYGILDRH